MTDERTALRLTILETLGAPLLLAVDAAAPAGDTAAAEQIAALLGRAVQASIALGDSLKLATTDDAARVALAGLGARLVAAQYAAGSGRIPGDAEIRRVVTAAEAVLSFADNFTPGAEGRARLEMLDAGEGGGAPDETQMAIQFMAALLPVVEAVAAFSFGRPEKKLVQEIADRLTGDAEDLRRDIAGDGLAPGAARRADLQALRVLCGVYAACHRAETRHLDSLGPADRDRIAAGGQIPMEPVWDAYAQRLAMLGVLGGGADERSAGPAPQAQPVTPPPPVAPPPPTAPPQAVPAAEGGAANPMSFFAKKKGDGDQQAEGG